MLGCKYLFGPPKGAHCNLWLYKSKISLDHWSDDYQAHKHCLRKPFNISYIFTILHLPFYITQKSVSVIYECLVSMTFVFSLRHSCMDVYKIVAHPACLTGKKVWGPRKVSWRSSEAALAWALNGAGLVSEFVAWLVCLVWFSLVGLAVSSLVDLFVFSVRWLV